TCNLEVLLRRRRVSDHSLHSFNHAKRGGTECGSLHPQEMIESKDFLWQVLLFFLALQLGAPSARLEFTGSSPGVSGVRSEPGCNRIDSLLPNITECQVGFQVAKYVRAVDVTVNHGRPLNGRAVIYLFSATNRLITSKDHASVQINTGHLDENGVYTGQFTTFALCGFVRAQ
ncbi:hypothetical protein KI387_030436, partial [Taxus chinensis]